MTLDQILTFYRFYWQLYSASCKIFYLAEFDFRWNKRHVTDGETMFKAVKGGDGKRLEYRGLIGG